MLEKIKENFRRRIEKNAIKSEVSWEDIDGKIQNETVYMKRSRIPLIGDWARIYPAVNEDGSWNFINLVFGGRRNFIKLLLILGLVALFIYGTYDIIHQYTTLLEDQCVKSCIKGVII